MPNKVLEQIIGAISSFPSIEAAYIFGSRALGAFGNGSNINALSVRLDDLNLPYKIDLVII